MVEESGSSKALSTSKQASGVVLLEISRPPVNAFDERTWRELGRTVKELSRDSEVRVIVLASALDRYYTAGLELKHLDILDEGADLDPARKALTLQRHVLEFQSAISSLAESRIPVIAAIHGLCVGLGVDITSACDIRLAAEDSTFAIAEVDVGLAADIGTLQRFPKVVGNDSLARELAMSGRRFNAQEAKEIGFLSAVVPGSRKEVTGAALDLAEKIARKSPIAVLSTKHLMNHSRDHSVSEGLAYTATWNSAMLQTRDIREAVNALKTKKLPEFATLPMAAPKPRAKL